MKQTPDSPENQKLALIAKPWNFGNESMFTLYMKSSPRFSLNRIQPAQHRLSSQLFAYLNSV